MTTCPSKASVKCFAAFCADLRDVARSRVRGRDSRSVKTAENPDRDVAVSPIREFVGKCPIAGKSRADDGYTGPKLQVRLSESGLGRLLEIPRRPSTLRIQGTSRTLVRGTNIRDAVNSKFQSRLRMRCRKQAWLAVA